MIDNNTLSDIYDKHARELFVYIFGFVRSRESAEDILHDAFVRLIRFSRDHPLDERNIRAYLYKIAKNLCIDHVRKNRNKQESTLHDNIEYTGSRTVQEDVEYNDLRQRVAGLIDKKDPVSRSVYIMRTELSFTYEEIAKNLGISERTAKRKMKAMLEYLAESLEKHGYKLILLILLALMAANIVI
jgi:RNA polymerase sigma-70 factor (ECF subfamily)